MTTTPTPHPDAGSRAVYRAVSRLISRPTRCGISHQTPCTSRAASRAGSRRKFYAPSIAFLTHFGVFQAVFANKQRICATSCRARSFPLPRSSDIFRQKKPPQGSLSGTRCNARKNRNAGAEHRTVRVVSRALLYKIAAASCASLAARHYRGSKQKSRYKCPILRRAAISTSRKAAASHRRNVRCADRGGKRLSSPPRTPQCRRRPAGMSCPRRRRARWRRPPRDFGRRWRWRHGGQEMRCRSV